MSRQLQILLLIIAPGCLYYYVLMPLYAGKNDNLNIFKKGENIVALRGVSSDYDLTLAEAKKISDKAESLKKRYNLISKEDSQKLDIILPKSLDQVVLLNEINSIFDKSGFKIEGLAYNKGTAKFSPDVGTYTLTLSTKGTYEHFKNLVHHIETSMHFYTIKELSFSTPEKEGEPMGFSIKLETYYLK